MKMLDLETTCTHIHTLQVELPFLSGRWPTLPKAEASANGYSPRVEPKYSPILSSLVGFSSYWMQLAFGKLEIRWGLVWRQEK